MEISNRLVALGHSITLVVPGSASDPEITADLDPKIEVRCVSQLRDPLSLLQKIALTFKLAQAVPSSDVLISTHAPTTAVVFLAARVMRKGKAIWFCQDYAEMFRGKHVENWLLQNALRWHLGAIVVSTSLKEELNGYVRHKPVFICLNGLSHPEFFKPTHLPTGRPPRSNPQTIVYLGDTRPRKGWDDFWDAAKIVYQRNPNILLKIISKEPCPITSNIPYEFILRPSDQEIAQILASCDVFVSATWWEGFGLPPLEAMACGAPVVMTDSHGGRDYAKPGENCIMVPPRNPLALAEAICLVLSTPDLADKLRRNGPSTSANFTWNKAAACFENSLSQILTGRVMKRTKF